MNAVIKGVRREAHSCRMLVVVRRCRHVAICCNNPCPPYSRIRSTLPICRSPDTPEIFRMKISGTPIRCHHMDTFGRYWRSCQIPIPAKKHIFKFVETTDPWNWQRHFSEVFVKQILVYPTNRGVNTSPLNQNRLAKATWSVSPTLAVFNNQTLALTTFPPPLQYHPRKAWEEEGCSGAFAKRIVDFCEGSISF